MKKNNRYVVFKNTLEPETRLFYAQTFEDGLVLKAKKEEDDTTSTWTIAKVDTRRLPNIIRRLVIRLDNSLKEIE